MSSHWGGTGSRRSAVWRLVQGLAHARRRSSAGAAHLCFWTTAESGNGSRSQLLFQICASLPLIPLEMTERWPDGTAWDSCRCLERVLEERCRAWRVKVICVDNGFKQGEEREWNGLCSEAKLCQESGTRPVAFFFYPCRHRDWRDGSRTSSFISLKYLNNRWMLAINMTPTVSRVIRLTFTLSSKQKF